MKKLRIIVVALSLIGVAASAARVTAPTGMSLAPHRYVYLQL